MLCPRYGSTPNQQFAVLIDLYWEYFDTCDHAIKVIKGRINQLNFKEYTGQKGQILFAIQGENKEKYFNAFHTTDLFLYPLKKSENL